MKKLTVRVNNRYCDLLIANTALNIADAYTVMLGLDAIPLIKLLKNSEVDLVTSNGLLELRYGETGLCIKFYEWMKMENFLFYEGIVAPKIISNSDFYNKYINQNY